MNKLLLLVPLLAVATPDFSNVPIAGEISEISTASIELRSGYNVTTFQNRLSLTQIKYSQSDPTENNQTKISLSFNLYHLIFNENERSETASRQYEIEAYTTLQNFKIDYVTISLESEVFTYYKESNNISQKINIKNQFFLTNENGVSTQLTRTNTFTAGYNLNSDYSAYSIQNQKLSASTLFFILEDIYNIGYQYGYNLGNENGYNNGFNDGYASADSMKTKGVWDFITTMFYQMKNILDIKILGEITIGMIVAVPIILGLLKFFLNVFR